MPIWVLAVGFITLSGFGLTEIARWIRSGVLPMKDGDPIQRSSQPLLFWFGIAFVLTICIVFGATGVLTGLSYVRRISN